MKPKLNKLTAFIVLVGLSGGVSAMDSTAMLPASGHGNSLQANPQTTMVMGYTSYYTKYADYTVNPTSVNSLPTNPAACALSDSVINFAYGPASTVQSVCTGYTCDTSCSWYDVSCWSEVAACETCIGTGVCNVFSCSCPKNECTNNAYSWTGTFTGPVILTSITCGTPGFVTSAANAQRAANVQTAINNGRAVAVQQINGLIGGLNNLANGISNGNASGISGTVASGLSAATAEAEQVAEQAAQALADAASSIGDTISSWF